MTWLAAPMSTGEGAVRGGISIVWHRNWGGARRVGSPLSVASNPNSQCPNTMYCPAECDFKSCRTKRLNYTYGCDSSGSCPTNYTLYYASFQRINNLVLPTQVLFAEGGNGRS